MSSLGYNRPLYLLPFDHRQSYVTGMFQFTPPLTADEHDIVADSKQVIYDGFQQALGNGVPTARAGILVDEEFGAGILRDAIEHGYVTALSTEKSGSMSSSSSTARRSRNTSRPSLRPSQRCWCATTPKTTRLSIGASPRGSNSCPIIAGPMDQLFMFELLVPATKAQMDRVQGDNATYDRQIRPELMLQTIRTLQDAGVEPDIWKIEGLDHRKDCERVVEMARRDGRDEVGCIVLGRGADEKKVVGWLETAASVPGFIGFAVGRTTFWDAVADYEAHRMTRQEAAARVAQRYREWAAIFEQSHPSLLSRA